MRIYDRLFCWAQYPLPHHLLSRLVLRLTRLEIRALKNLGIKAFCAYFKPNLSEAEHTDIDSYPSFNAFFTRALKPGVRPIAQEPRDVISPVDGAVSQSGEIKDGMIFQAKGRWYSAAELFGSEAEAQPFIDGAFATIYLAPKDYHRIHMPFPGKLTKMIYLPGRLFSVNPAAARTVPRLFARNERVVTIYETEIGPMAVIFVGALFVSACETAWHGLVTPPHRKPAENWDYTDQAIHFSKGDEIGRFNMGSTVIVSFGEGAVTWSESLTPEAALKMGERIAVTG